MVKGEEDVFLPPCLGHPASPPRGSPIARLHQIAARLPARPGHTAYRQVRAVRVPGRSAQGERSSAAGHLSDVQ